MEMKKFLKITLAPVVGMGKKSRGIRKVACVMPQSTCCAQQALLENPMDPVREKITREEGLYHLAMVVHIYPDN
jgi:hypothetical protein